MLVAAHFRDQAHVSIRFGDASTAPPSLTASRLRSRHSNLALAVLVTVVVLAASIAGCVLSKQETLVPTTAGIITGFDRTPTDTVLYHLASGEDVEIDFDTANVILPDGGPVEGDLLLSGSEPSGRPWIVGLKPNMAIDVPPDCFDLVATGTGIDGWIDLSIGIRLPKAANFDPGPISNEQFVAERSAFCVNSMGEVLSYG